MYTKFFILSLTSGLKHCSTITPTQTHGSGYMLIRDTNYDYNQYISNSKTSLQIK